jgi:hypothetical protein
MRSRAKARAFSARSNSARGLLATRGAGVFLFVLLEFVLLLNFQAKSAKGETELLGLLGKGFISLSGVIFCFLLLN